MKLSPYAKLKTAKLSYQSLTIGILAWLGIVLTWSAHWNSFYAGLLMGLHFFLPVTLAMLFTHNCWIKPTWIKLTNKADWPRRSGAAISYGVLFAFLTSILICLLYVGEASLMQLYVDLIHPERQAEIQTAKQTVEMSYFLVILGPLCGVWAWLPLGVLQGYLLLEDHANVMNT